MLVKNINGTIGNICKCGSWLDHWKNFSGKFLPATCSEIRCYQSPTVGAHVQKGNSTDSSWYIVPLCREHNAETGKSHAVIDSVVFVSANVSKSAIK